MDLGPTTQLEPMGPEFQAPVNETLFRQREIDVAYRIGPTALTHDQATPSTVTNVEQPDPARLRAFAEHSRNGLYGY